VTAGALTVLASAAVGVGVPWWQARRERAHGVELIAAGRYRAAARTLVRAVAARPGDAHAHYYLGLAYSRIGMREGALQQLADAARLAGDDPIGALARRELAAARRPDPAHADSADHERSMR
jgi:Flp pilus assembly protein TadD